jgi:hypothetical protein
LHADCLPHQDLVEVKGYALECSVLSAFDYIGLRLSASECV